MGRRDPNEPARGVRGRNRGGQPGRAARVAGRDMAMGEGRIGERLTALGLDAGDFVRTAGRARGPAARPPALLLAKIQAQQRQINRQQAQIDWLMRHVRGRLGAESECGGAPVPRPPPQEEQRPTTSVHGSFARLPALPRSVLRSAQGSSGKRLRHRCDRAATRFGQDVRRRRGDEPGAHTAPGAGAQCDL